MVDHTAGSRPESRRQGTGWFLILRALSTRSVRMSGGLLLIIVCVAIFAPLISPHDPIRMTPRDRLKSPGAGYLLGTDEYGRDVLSRILWGARISLAGGGLP